MWKKLKKRFGSTESYVSLILGIAVVLLLGSLVFNYVSGKRQDQTQKALETQKQQENNQNIATHTVADGETLWSISEKYYKSGYNWVDIQKANNLTDADLIESGQKLVIPKATPIVLDEGQISAATVTAKPSPATYTVAHGDSLWSISLAHYGTGYRWEDIAKANNLADPQIIHSGNVLALP